MVALTPKPFIIASLKNSKFARLLLICSKFHPNAHFRKYEMIVLVETFAAHLPKDAFSRTSVDWKAYLESEEINLNLYRCGRPIVYSALMAAENTFDLQSLDEW